MINGGRIVEALTILEKIFQESKIIRYGQRLAFTYLALRHYQKASNLLDELKELHLQQKMEKKLKSDDPFGSNDMEEPMYLQYLEGLILLAINRPRLALPILESVQKKNPANFHVAFNIAQIHNQRKNYASAEKQFICALAIDEGNGKAHHGLGVSFLRRNLIDQAIEEFLLAISNDFYLPNAHYHLGESLMKKEQYDDAAYAFEVAVRLSPGLTKAHKWLYEIYSKWAPNEVLASKTSNFLKHNIQGEITICTSIDGVNIAEMFNWFKQQDIPSEYDNKSIDDAKKLVSDTSWLTTKRNEIIYIPCHCLSLLPVDLNYKLIVLEEDSAQVIDALKEAHKRDFKEKEFPLELLNKSKKDQDKIDTWIASQATLPVLILHTESIKTEEEEQAEILKNFINFD
jgi:tetratricopeptide (TPR) repeat protein